MAFRSTDSEVQKLISLPKEVYGKGYMNIYFLFILFLINMGVRASLRVSRLIFRSLKLTTI
jgi:hypothetical protein